MHRSTLSAGLRQAGQDRRLLPARRTLPRAPCRCSRLQRPEPLWQSRSLHLPLQWLSKDAMWSRLSITRWVGSPPYQAPRPLLPDPFLWPAMAGLSAKQPALRAQLGMEAEAIARQARPRLPSSRRHPSSRWPRTAGGTRIPLPVQAAGAPTMVPASMCTETATACSAFRPTRRPRAFTDPSQRIFADVLSDPSDDHQRAVFGHPRCDAMIRWRWLRRR